MNGRRGAVADLANQLGAVCLMGLLAGPVVHAREPAAAPSRPWTDWSVEQRHRDDALRAEANANYLTPRECRLVSAALAARKARAEAEIAAREQLRLERRLAIAAAAAAEKSREAGGGGERVAGSVAPDVAGAGVAEPAARSVISFLTPVQPGVSVEVPVPQRAAPLRVEGGLQRNQPEGRREGTGVSQDARPLIGTAPFGVPIPGRSGFVTSPPQLPAGVIDVRGFQAGEEVVDPYTGQPIRVP